MSIHFCENMPKFEASTLSPGDSVLEIAASQPPVPVAGKITTSPASVFSTFFTPSSAGCRISANRAER